MSINLLQRFFPVLAAVVLLITGCDHDDEDKKVGSSDVTTGKISMDAHVTASEADEIYVSAQLLSGGLNSNIQVELERGDELWASVDRPVVNDSISGDLFDTLPQLADRHSRLREVTEVLFELDFFFLDFIIKGDILLYSSVLLNSADASAYYLSFFRRNGTDAPNSFVRLPGAFALTAPMANNPASRTNPIQIAWEPSGSADEVQLVFSLSCINDGKKTVSITVPGDPGSYLVAGGDLNGTGITGNCSTTFEVTKNNLGTLDSRIGSGRIVGHQVRRVTFTTN